MQTENWSTDWYWNTQIYLQLLELVFQNDMLYHLQVAPSDPKNGGGTLLPSSLGTCFLSTLMAGKPGGWGEKGRQDLWDRSKIKRILEAKSEEFQSKSCSYTVFQLFLVEMTDGLSFVPTLTEKQIEMISRQSCDCLPLFALNLPFQDHMISKGKLERKSKHTLLKCDVSNRYHQCVYVQGSSSSVST